MVMVTDSGWGCVDEWDVSIDEMMSLEQMVEEVVVSMCGRRVW